ncbi:MAG: sterol desaturase family protein [Myxococcota bacterium]
MALLTYAIPGFLGLIALEAAIAARHHRVVYRLNDTINNLSLGILNQVVSVATAASLVVPYIWLYENFHLLPLDELSPMAWVLGLLGVDLAYYWFHRTAHERNLMWAAHAVHHQSEEYNLSVALRQSAFEPWFSWVFRLPLALLGVPPVTMMASVGINTMYQFWVHTRLIERLGPLEWVLNTPSHHRVHHGRNPRYLDRNYGGMLIVWDRLFGTFQEEDAEPVYGVTTPLASWDPLWANVRSATLTVRSVWDAPRADQLRVWWMPPGWTPDGMKSGGAPLDQPKYDVRPPRAGWWVWPMAQLTLTMGLTVALLTVSGALSGWTVAAVSGWVVFSLVNIGAIMERRAWAQPSQVALMATTVILILALNGGLSV